MANQNDNPNGPVLELEDFETLFNDEDGVDQVLAAISWFERADAKRRREAPGARAMGETIRNAPRWLADQLTALIGDFVTARTDGDPDLMETAVVEAWDLLVLRDRLEDLRALLPEIFDVDARTALDAFDGGLDRADVWLEELDDARLQMGSQQGKSERRWWRPREDFGPAEWDLPPQAHPDTWIPDDDEVAAWHRGELAPLRAAAVSAYFERTAPVKVAGLSAGALGSKPADEPPPPPDTVPPVGDLEGGVRAPRAGVELRFMTVESPLDTFRIDLTTDASGVVLVDAAGAQTKLIGYSPRVWWVEGLAPTRLVGARVIAFRDDGSVIADIALDPLPTPAET